MKKQLLIAMISGVFALSTVLAGCSGGSGGTESSSKGSASAAESDKVVKLNLGHILTPESHYQVMVNKLVELADQKSNGTIKITAFPQSQLGGEVKMIQSARSGTLGMFITGQAALENTVKEYAILDLPYLFDDIDQANKVLKGDVGKKYLEMLKQHDLVGLGWLSAMERNIFSTKPVRTVEDMKALKIRVMQAPGYVKTFEQLGAQPTPMSYAEVYLSLQQGVIDGGDISPDQFMMDKFVEVAKYYNLTKTHYLPALLVMSKKNWDEMSPNQQKALQEAADEALQVGIDFYKQSYAESLEKAKQQGVQIIETDLSGFKQQAEKTHESLLQDIPNGKELYEEIQKAKKQ
ncbi:TRAP transporter substrate-binding protein [Brevibacillus ruminantium]|uniref:TRAP transporter substrate-binding protein n=1 Tax=Brevibacillus ruminantium TaxID=2950604 RepID=A0ABY4WIP1_9BACL|nr:TRAP transporter substrate-binding protein [Brevibacillus ruminantium]USG66569.1 TRAP transporter substrate-binding protein [Brevibacillus ruminantium]